MNKRYFKPYRKEYELPTPKPLNKGRERKKGWNKRVKLRTQVRRMNVAMWLDSPVWKDGSLRTYVVVCPILQEQRKLLANFPTAHAVQVETPTYTMYWVRPTNDKLERGKRVTSAKPAFRDLCLPYRNLRYYRKWTAPKWGN